MAVYHHHPYLLRVQHQESRTTSAKVNRAPLDEDSVPIKSSLSERLGFRRHQRQRLVQPRTNGEEKPKLWSRVLDLEV